jgi:hypothetical protein
VRLILNASEVERAVQRMMADKVGGTVPNDWLVRIKWRGKYAVVDRLRPPPVLTDAVAVPNVETIEIKTPAFAK